MERAMGIEPTLSAWKAEVLPLNYARIGKLWWRGQDSNLRRLSRQIYSLIPLAAREPLPLASFEASKLELARGVEPPTG